MDDWVGAQRRREIRKQLLFRWERMLGRPVERSKTRTPNGAEEVIASARSGSFKTGMRV